jgi:hypothetical protein
METIKRDSSLAGFGIEYETDYQTYMSRLLDEQLVHPDDADEFRSIMTLDQLRLCSMKKDLSSIASAESSKPDISGHHWNFSRILNVPKKILGSLWLFMNLRQ